jgi:hypothetical protein
MRSEKKRLGKKIADNFMGWFNKGVVNTQKLKKIK